MYNDPSSEAFNPDAIKDLPNILIIGDSISMGYTPYVKTNLMGIFNTYRISVNGGSTVRGMENLDLWLGENMAWSAITFNFGLHDLVYSDYDEKNGTITNTPDKYAENLTDITKRLKAYADENNSCLFWCNTTPVPFGSHGRVCGSEAEYNKRAAEIMGLYNIPIVNLHTEVLKNQPLYQLPDGNVHMTEQGSEYLASVLTAYIKRALDK